MIEYRVSDNIFTLIGSFTVLCCIIVLCLMGTSFLASIMSNYKNESQDELSSSTHIHCQRNYDCPSGQYCNTVTNMCQNTPDINRTFVVTKPYYRHYYY